MIVANGSSGVYVLARDLLKTFQVSGADFTALDLPHLQVASGEAVALVGPSGSGKTTLLNIIAGLLSPTRGEVVVNGVTVTALGERERDRFRARHVGYVFQSFNLLAAFSALENVRLAMELSNSVPSRQRLDRARDLLAGVGLGHRLRHRPGQLSVGEQQRVAVARALANSPGLLLADEPTANVDPETRQEVIDRLLRGAREEGKILLLATHDHSLLPRFDRVVRLAAPELLSSTLEVADDRVASRPA